jgi:hypothetical protein
MGYTHYFSFKPVNERQWRDIETRYKRAILDCQRIVKAFYAKHGRISGYSAHTPLGRYGGLKVNGKGIDACEAFELREHYGQNLRDFKGYCKTNGLPYDTVVTACLAVLKHRLGDAIQLHSDGNRHDWSYGVRLARRVTGLKLKNPIVCLD